MSGSAGNQPDVDHGSSEHLPRVSIGLPVYNGENYLHPALDSLLAQTYKDFELIISDNASSDNTQNICEEYSEKDGRIRYLRNDTNIGAAANYNRVFDLAKGEYFKWAAHDDVCAPDFIQQSVDALDSDKSLILCYPTEIAIDKNGGVIPGYMNKYAVLKHAESASLFRRFHDIACLNHGCFQVFGLIRTSALALTPKIANYLGSDRVLLAQLSLMGRFHKTDAPTFFRRHSEQYCAMTDHSSRSVWFDPVSASNESSSKELRILSEYSHAISSSSLPLPKRFLCYIALMDRIWRKRGKLFTGLSSAKRYAKP